MKRKQDLINKENKQKNRNQKEHTQNSYMGPFIITAVRNTGIVRARNGKVTGTFNIRNITLYKE